MTEHTFSLTKKTSYRREDMLNRIALENAIVRAYDSPILDTDSSLARGFLVRSCNTFSREVVNDKGEKSMELIEDLRESMNVMDPLLWILNRLQIFPLS
jgi:hypothetical protein